MNYFYSILPSVVSMSSLTNDAAEVVGEHLTSSLKTVVAS